MKMFERPVERKKKRKGTAVCYRRLPSRNVNRRHAIGSDFYYLLRRVHPAGGSGHSSLEGGRPVHYPSFCQPQIISD